MVEYVKPRRLTLQKVANIMAKCCECGGFKPGRTEQLLEKMAWG